ncbi:hypothetical protein SSP24_27360 [Streptomyces spinoverrucosus]|uniref:Uncharacterized protein n=1 Tax=Streptomyces spinoverrucosus TaxID=284043 RepID=A0A4Y3VHG3_9ACTN|nr:hypothetical protein SSP24_27360 [Streptomyces spinoverrucosus]GHB71774.1 hypothetical protein GCM10010397_47520 [Streptomyces spinoverrucosus]
MRTGPPRTHAQSSAVSTLTAFKSAASGNTGDNDAFAVTTNRSSDVDGFANLRGNDFGGAATEVSRVGTFTTPPYGYSAEPASSVVASVTVGAGAGKL